MTAEPFPNNNPCKVSVQNIIFGNIFVELFGDIFVELFGDIFVELFGAIFVQLFGDIFVELFGDIFVELFGDIFVELFGDIFAELFGDIFVELFGDIFVELFGDIFVELFGDIISTTVSRPSLKVVSATFLLVCFVCLNESTRETRKCFLFHFESSFRSRDNQILTFQTFKSYDVIKCLSMKHETRIIE